MVYISKVYTKFGDKGETMLVDGSTAPKDDLRVRCYGQIDELNACIGMLRLELSREEDKGQDATYGPRLDAQLGVIQQELFNLGAELATPEFKDEGKKPCVQDRHIERLESQIDEHNERLEPLKSFILPGGGPAASAAHLCRTVCRRCEREMVALGTRASIRPQALKYVNRLSDYFFTVSRSASQNYSHSEVLWRPEDI